MAAWNLRGSGVRQLLDHRAGKRDRSVAGPKPMDVDEVSGNRFEDLTGGEHLPAEEEGQGMDEEGTLEQSTVPEQPTVLEKPFVHPSSGRRITGKSPFVEGRPLRHLRKESVRGRRRI